MNYCYNISNEVMLGMVSQNKIHVEDVIVEVCAKIDYLLMICSAIIIISYIIRIFAHLLDFKRVESFAETFLLGSVVTILVYGLINYDLKWVMWIILIILSIIVAMFYTLREKHVKDNEEFDNGDNWD